MHRLPRKLSIGTLTRLFEGRTRFVERLAGRENPLGNAGVLLREIPEEELIEALNAHPRIGARTGSEISRGEQGGEEDPAVLEELARLNQAYEEAFGFRFIFFVKSRPKSEILRVFRERRMRSRAEELRTAIEELVAIARDRYRRPAGARPSP